MTAKFSMGSTGVVVHNGDTVEYMVECQVSDDRRNRYDGRSYFRYTDRQRSFGETCKDDVHMGDVAEATKSATVATYLYNIPRLRCRTV